MSLLKSPLQVGELLDALAKDGLIDPRESKRIRFMPRGKEQQHPLNYIADQRLNDQQQKGRTIDIDRLLTWLSSRAGQSVYHIDPLKIDVPAVTEVMSFAFAKRHGILAVEVRDDDVLIASQEPFIDDWEENLRHVLRKQITRVVVDPEDIERYTIEFYSMAKSVVGATGNKQGTESSVAVASFEQLLDLGKLKEPDANDQHIVNIVDWLLQYAFEQRASDIHIEPRRELANVRFRIDGVLFKVYELPLPVAIAVTSRLKILGRMNVAEKRHPQDGRLKTRSPAGSEIELRLSTIPTAFGEKMVMRIFDPEVLVRSFHDLGLSDTDYDLWQSMTSRPHGIVLVTGPTGSGKTTTLYSTLKQLATPEVNVCTIEDPIEMVEASFNQMQVHSAIDLHFADGVRALLRQDPDIIMIGEIRDFETAEMAIQAALTGHLVLSTLHTNDAPSAITRLVELGVPAYLIRATVVGIMAQRLVRILCPHCRATEAVDPEAWQQLVGSWPIPAPAKTCRAVGCLECRNAGYLGRQGIYEILEMTDALNRQIQSDPDIEELRRVGIEGGMRPLRVAGADKVADGLTTIEEVMRVTPAGDQQAVHVESVTE